MPAGKDDAPVKIAVNLHKDGKVGPAPGPPPLGKGVPDMFGALANARRVVPAAPPPRANLFNPIAPRPPASEPASSYLDGDDEGSETDGDSVDSRDFDAMEENAGRTKALKSECLQKLHRYAQQGIPVPEHLGMQSSLEELQGECDRIKRNNDTQNAVKFQRRMLVTFVTGVEWMNGEYDPIGAHLQGWSKSVMAEIDSFDSVFERLYEKYQAKVFMPPELELLLAILMSAVAFHMQNMNPDTFRPFGMGQRTAAQPQPATRPAPPSQPQPQPQPPPQPEQQTKVVEARRPQPQPQPQQQPERPEEGGISRMNPDPPPYIMQGPGGGLGVLPGFAPMPLGDRGPALTPGVFPPGSAEALLQPPELTVPPREPTTKIVDITSPAPSRKRPPSRKKAPPSEAGIAI